MKAEYGRGPWQGIGRVLEAHRAGEQVEHHPSRRALRAYLRGRLPARPDRWTSQRAEALARGRLPAWTALEVAAHVSSCDKCQAYLHRVEASMPRGSWLPRVRWSDLIRKPKLARVGWALAGAQALALAGLLVWMGAFQPTQPASKPLDHILPGLSQLTQLESAVDAATPIRVQFAPHAEVGQLRDLADELNAQVFGPDDAGYYDLLLPEGVDVSLEELKAQPIVTDVQVGESR